MNPALPSPRASGQLPCPLCPQPGAVSIHQVCLFILALVGRNGMPAELWPLMCPRMQDKVDVKAWVGHLASALGILGTLRMSAAPRHRGLYSKKTQTLPCWGAARCISKNPASVGSSLVCGKKASEGTSRGPHGHLCAGKTVTCLFLTFKWRLCTFAR